MRQEEFETLLQFFKALANESRLKILGILANRECGVSELAALLELKEPTVSHHLHKLKEVGLVDVRAKGNDRLYRLNVRALEMMNKDVFTSDKMATLADDLEVDVWERKVLNGFLDGDHIKAVPTGYKKRLAVLKWLVSHFDMGVRYSEPEVNEIIERHHPDYCTLRREFVINGLMERENNIYWRTEWQMPEFDG
jgi:DNA-binding MarR family transcriptional regulator